MYEICRSGRCDLLLMNPSGPRGDGEIHTPLAEPLKSTHGWSSLSLTPSPFTFHFRTTRIFKQTSPLPPARPLLAVPLLETPQKLPARDSFRCQKKRGRPMRMCSPLFISRSSCADPHAPFRFVKATRPLPLARSQPQF